MDEQWEWATCEACGQDIGFCADCQRKDARIAALEQERAIFQDTVKKLVALDAPERIWVARNARLKLVVNFSQHDLPGEVEYVRADLYATLEQERERRKEPSERSAYCVNHGRVAHDDFKCVYCEVERLRAKRHDAMKVKQRLRAANVVHWEALEYLANELFAVSLADVPLDKLMDEVRALNRTCRAGAGYTRQPSDEPSTPRGTA